ncbi:MAG TPA: hypothetical protein VNT54_00535 [Solirubrobacteraceae bacterium]|nr:hypothetical protein [Solirubrobacteraceae bacterium]
MPDAVGLVIFVAMAALLVAARRPHERLPAASRTRWRATPTRSCICDGRARQPAAGPSVLLVGFVPVAARIRALAAVAVLRSR